MWQPGILPQRYDAGPGWGGAGQREEDAFHEGHQRGERMRSGEGSVEMERSRFGCEQLDGYCGLLAKWEKAGGETGWPERGGAQMQTPVGHPRDMREAAGCMGLASRERRDWGTPGTQLTGQDQQGQERSWEGEDSPGGSPEHNMEGEGQKSKLAHSRHEGESTREREDIRENERREHLKVHKAVTLSPLETDILIQYDRDDDGESRKC